MAKYGEIKLGDRVQAKVDKFEGIAAGITEYLHQCRQILVKPEKLTTDGASIAGLWVDEPWLDVTAKGVHKAEAVAYDHAGRPASGALDSHPTPNVPTRASGGA